MKADVMQNPILIAAAVKPSRKSAKKSRDEAPEAPSPKQMKLDAAHRAHRDVVESWVRGDASTEKMNKSRARLAQVARDCK